MAGPSFPKVRIGDDVRAQHRLLAEKSGLESLALVVGGSMGAQQTYEWAVRYPDFVERAASIAGTAKNTEHDLVVADTLCEAIASDPGFKNGNYDAPSDVAAGVSCGRLSRRRPATRTVRSARYDIFLMISKYRS